MSKLPKELVLTLEFLQDYGSFYRGPHGVSFGLEVQCKECECTIGVKDALAYFRGVSSNIFYQHLQVFEEMGLVNYRGTLSPMWKRIELTRRTMRLMGESAFTSGTDYLFLDHCELVHEPE